MLVINASLWFFTCVLMLQSLRRMHSNLVSNAKNHMSSWFWMLCPYACNHKDIRKWTIYPHGFEVHVLTHATIRTYAKNHKEKSIRRNHKECIVYQTSKTIGQVTSLKHMSLCIVSLLMVEVYVLMVFLHKDGASPLWWRTRENDLLEPRYENPVIQKSTGFLEI